MADPIGTIRRENYDNDGYSIWIRMDPGYPDNEFADTEWTCVWSTMPGDIGAHMGARVIEDQIPEASKVTGEIPDTPAHTGSDCSVGDRVEVHPGALYWTHEPVRGRITTIGSPDESYYFEITFDEPQPVAGRFPTTHTRWSLRRVHFALLES